jgi:hypothetical protein
VFFSAVLSAPELYVFAPSDFEARIVRFFAQEAWVRVDQFLLKLSKSFQDLFVAVLTSCTADQLAHLLSGASSNDYSIFSVAIGSVHAQRYGVG